MQMRMLLPLLLRGEAEGLVQILLVANLVKGRSTSPQIKFLMLSGRLGKNVFLLTLSLLSYDFASGSEITPCNKIDKRLVVYRFTGNNNAAYIMKKIITFSARNDISK